MRPRRLLRASLLALVAMTSAVAVGGCGNTQPNPAPMGFNADLGGISYNIVISRELNLADAEDSSYYRGQPAPPGSGYFGVFLQACNNDSQPHIAASDFTVRDSRGGTFKPLVLGPDNIFAYRPRELNPGQCEPERGSIAAQGPTNGSLVLFQLPFRAIQNTPVDLDVVGPTSAAGLQPQVQSFELGIG